MIYFGAANLNNCTIEPFIPIFLLIGGICLLIDQCAHGFIYCCRDNEQHKDKAKSTYGAALDSFSFIWFIIGSIFVYRISTPNYDSEKGLFCDRTTYLLAYWLVTIQYIIMGALVLLACCICLCVCFCAAASSDDDNDDTEANRTPANTNGNNPIPAKPQAETV